MPKKNAIVPIADDNLGLFGKQHKSSARAKSKEKSDASSVRCMNEELNDVEGMVAAISIAVASVCDEPHVVESRMSHVAHMGNGVITSEMHAPHDAQAAGLDQTRLRRPSMQRLSEVSEAQDIRQRQSPTSPSAASEKSSSTGLASLVSNRHDGAASPDVVAKSLDAITLQHKLRPGARQANVALTLPPSLLDMAKQGSSVHAFEMGPLCVPMQHGGDLRVDSTLKDLADTFDIQIQEETSHCAKQGIGNHEAVCRGDAAHSGLGDANTSVLRADQPHADLNALDGDSLQNFDVVKLTKLHAAVLEDRLPPQMCHVTKSGLTPAASLHLSSSVPLPPTAPDTMVHVLDVQQQSIGNCSASQSNHGFAEVSVVSPPVAVDSTGVAQLCPAGIGPSVLVGVGNVYGSDRARPGSVVHAKVNHEEGPQATDDMPSTGMQSEQDASQGDNLISTGSHVAAQPEMQACTANDLKLQSHCSESTKTLQKHRVMSIVPCGTPEDEEFPCLVTALPTTKHEGQTESFLDKGSSSVTRHDCSESLIQHESTVSNTKPIIAKTDDACKGQATIAHLECDVHNLTSISVAESVCKHPVSSKHMHEIRLQDKQLQDDGISKAKAHSDMGSNNAWQGQASAPCRSSAPVHDDGPRQLSECVQSPGQSEESLMLWSCEKIRMQAASLVVDASGSHGVNGESEQRNLQALVASDVLDNKQAAPVVQGGAEPETCADAVVHEVSDAFGRQNARSITPLSGMTAQDASIPAVLSAEDPVEALRQRLAMFRSAQEQQAQQLAITDCPPAYCHVFPGLVPSQILLCCIYTVLYILTLRNAVTFVGMHAASISCCNFHNGSTVSLLFEPPRLASLLWLGMCMTPLM
jgi:hypothetical protein